MRVTVDKKGQITVSDFSSLQAYKIAANMEERGIAFYGDLLRKISDKEAMQEIEILIVEERAHLKTFRDLLAREKEAVDDRFEEDDVVDYLNANIFDISLQPEVAEAMDHRHTSLEEALHMERRSILFYETCLKQTQAEAALAAFTKIIDEEKRHLEKFAQLLRSKCIQSKKGCVL
jgi:rubrerythrin